MSARAHIHAMLQWQRGPGAGDTLLHTPVDATNTADRGGQKVVVCGAQVLDAYIIPGLAGRHI